VRLQPKKKRNSSLKSVTEHTGKWSNFEINSLLRAGIKKVIIAVIEKPKDHHTQSPSLIPGNFLAIKALVESDLRGDSGIGLMEDR